MLCIYHSTIMAVTRRGYIFAAFLLSVISILLVVVAISSDNWITSTARSATDTSESNTKIQYGLFRGELELYILVTPTINTLYMTCLPDINACAVSCKTEKDAREAEVRALAERKRPNPNCVAVTNIEEGNLLTDAVISFAFYVCLLLVMLILLLFTVISAVLAIVNATMNPTEPVFGLPGCLWSNVIASTLGVIALLMFGIYFASSGLNEHLALSYVATGTLTASPSIGFSYWLVLVASILLLTNVGLIELRRYLLERDPPPPTIKVENHSDGTIFLY